MKKLIYFITLAVLVFTSCYDEEAANAKEEVRFTLGITDAINDSGRKAADLPDNVSLQVTITDQSGDAVLTNEKITLLKMNGEYISEPIALAAGKYILTHFMIVDDKSEVLYATPQKGSKLAAIVQRSLPYNFSVSRNDARNISIEVVEVGSNQPGDFGYAAFHVGIAYPLEIAVFVQNGSTLEFTSATAYLFGSHDSSVYNLSAKVNLVSFRAHPDSSYTLQVQKEGYLLFERPFNYRELQSELNGKPLEVILRESPPSEPQPAIIITPCQGYLGIWAGFTGQGSVTFDWGNGETEDAIFGPESEQDGLYSVFRSHADPGAVVKITGDIHLVASFSFDYACGFDGEHAPALTEVSFIGGEVQILDLEHNTNMTYLLFQEVSCA